MKSIKSILLINGISSGATGLLLVAFAKAAAELFAVQDITAFIATGIFFICFAAYVLYTATKKVISKSGVRAIITMDVLWVLMSAFILSAWHGEVSAIGNIAIVAVALWVAMMAILQYGWLKKSGMEIIKRTFTLLSMLLVITGYTGW